MFAQTFSEDPGRIGQFVKESHCKIKIWVTSSIWCITECSIGVVLTQNMFLNKKLVYSDTFHTLCEVIGREWAGNRVLELWERLFEGLGNYTRGMAGSGSEYTNFIHKSSLFGCINNNRDHKPCLRSK